MCILINAPQFICFSQSEPAPSTTDGLTGNESPIPLDEGIQYSYLVKVLDGDGKKGYKVHKIRTSKLFASREDIEDQLHVSLKEHIPGDTFDVGYIEASRQGIRGKTRWIFSSDDIDDMYKSYSSACKTEIILWCHGRKQTRKKRPLPATEDSDGGSKRSRTPCSEAIRKTMDEVTAIYQTLDKKHHGTYSPEQLKVWAHLINNRSHESYETAPNKRFFHGGKGKDTATCATEFSSVKRCNLRSQYVVQLKDLHTLCENGNLSQKEFDDQKCKIMEHLNKL